VGSGRESGVNRVGPDIHPTAKVSELFADDHGSVHAVYCLRGSNVASYASDR